MGCFAPMDEIGLGVRLVKEALLFFELDLGGLFSKSYRRFCAVKSLKLVGGHSDQFSPVFVNCLKLYLSLFLPLFLA